MAYIAHSGAPKGAPRPRRVRRQRLAPPAVASHSHSPDALRAAPLRVRTAEDLVIAAAGPLTHGPQAAVWGILYAIARASQGYGWIWCAP